MTKHMTIAEVNEAYRAYTLQKLLAPYTTRQ